MIECPGTQILDTIYFRIIQWTVVKQHSNVKKKYIKHVKLHPKKLGCRVTDTIEVCCIVTDTRNICCSNATGK
jgi:hypothetical protein